MNDMTVGLREEALQYLWDSSFVSALCKKSIYPSDIDNLYEDYLQECWLSILELKDEVWLKLYNSSIEKDTDYQYEIRNYVSRVILNTCHSKSSNAYRKLKKSAKYETTQDNVKWDVIKNTLPDSTEITEQILSMDD